MSMTLKEQIKSIKGYKNHSKFMGYRIEVEVFTTVLKSLQDYEKLLKVYNKHFEVSAAEDEL